MADTKISALAQLAVAPATNDRLVIVDVSDTSMAASGTDKYILLSDLLANYQPLDTDLTAIAALTSAVNKMLVSTGTGTWALNDIGALSQLFVASTTAQQMAGVIHTTYPLFDHITSVGNITTGEDDLWADTIVAGTLGSDGQKITAWYGGTTAAHATATRQIRVYFDGTKILDAPATATPTNINNWMVDLTIMRTSNTQVRYNAKCIRGVPTATGVVWGQQTGVLSGLTSLTANDKILKITGEAAAAGAATNDIVSNQGAVLLTGAA